MMIRKMILPLTLLCLFLGICSGSAIARCISFQGPGTSLIVGNEPTPEGEVQIWAFFLKDDPMSESFADYFPNVNENEILRVGLGEHECIYSKIVLTDATFIKIGSMELNPEDRFTGKLFVVCTDGRTVEANLGTPQNPIWGARFCYKKDGVYIQNTIPWTDDGQGKAILDFLFGDVMEMPTPTATCTPTITSTPTIPLPKIVVSKSAVAGKVDFEVYLNQSSTLDEYIPNYDGTPWVMGVSKQKDDLSEGVLYTELSEYKLLSLYDSLGFTGNLYIYTDYGQYLFLDLTGWVTIFQVEDEYGRAWLQLPCQRTMVDGQEMIHVPADWIDAPPTLTPTATLTPRPPTWTPTQTNTPDAPTMTPTAVPTNTPTPTDASTMTPTAVPTNTPTNTFTASPTPTLTMDMNGDGVVDGKDLLMLLDGSGAQRSGFEGQAFSEKLFVLAEQWGGQAR